MSLHQKLADYFCQHNRGWVLSLFAVACIIYLPFLGSPFFFDDLSFFTAGIPEHFGTVLFSINLRWLPYATLGRTWTWVGDIPHVYRLSNLFIHAVTVILLFFFLRKLVTTVLPDIQATIVTRGAWLGAFIFACHPVAVYAVGYVVQRSILMATMFSLVMLLAYLRGMVSGQKYWLAIAVIAYLLAGFSREHSVMLPAVLAAMTVLLREKNQVSKPVLFLTWAMFMVVGLLLILSSKGVIGEPYEVMASTLFQQQQIAVSAAMLHLLSAMTQAGLFFKYLLLWLLPNPAWMSIDMRENFIFPWTELQGWLGVVSFIGYGVLGFWLLWRQRWQGLMGLALLYPWLQYIVEFSTIRIQEPFVLYRSYLWMPGLALLIPLLVIKFTGRKALIVLCFLAVMLVPLSWNRLWVLADNYRLWNDAALLLQHEQVAGADRIFYNRGNAFSSAHKWQEAIADLQKVRALNPKIVQVRNALGNAYFNAGRYQEAITEFDVAISLQQDDAQAYIGKGMSLKRLHEDDLAMEQIEKACELQSMVACMIAGTAKGK